MNYKTGNISKITDSLNGIFNNLKNECKENAKTLSDAITNYLNFFATELDNLDKKFKQDGLSGLQQEKQKYMILFELLNKSENC